MNWRIGCAALLALMLAEPALGAASKARAVAKMDGLDGKALGSATFAQTGHGVLIEISLHDIAPGAHAMHVHTSGNCDAKKGFYTAGPVFSPVPGKLHGYMAKGGPEAGDLPNQFASADGMLHASVITNSFSLGNGKKTLFDRDGASIIVDAKADDYVSQPIGNSGARIACGVIIRTVAPGSRKGGSRRKHG